MTNIFGICHYSSQVGNLISKILPQGKLPASMNTSPENYFILTLFYPNPNKSPKTLQHLNHL